MDMFFSAKWQTLAQFMEVYDRQRLNEVHGGYLTPWPTNRPKTGMRS